MIDYCLGVFVERVKKKDRLRFIFDRSDPVVSIGAIQGNEGDLVLMAPTPKMPGVVVYEGACLSHSRICEQYDVFELSFAKQGIVESFEQFLPHTINEPRLLSTGRIDVLAKWLDIVSDRSASISAGIIWVEVLADPATLTE